MEEKSFLELSKYLIYVIKQVLNNEKVEPINENSNINYYGLFKLASFHQVENITFQGVSEYLDEELKKIWKKKSLQNITMCLTQEEEKNHLVELFNSKKIDFLPVKGFYIRALYPRLDFRFMSDYDILVKEEQRSNVKKILLEDGYYIEDYNEFNHDSYKKDPFIHLEIHRSLVRYDESSYEYYKNVFSKAFSDEKTPYLKQLSKEDLYIFSIVHLYKHYSLSGSGIRSLVDIYLSNIKEDLNRVYIDEELKKLSLFDFENMIRTIAFDLLSKNDTNSFLEEKKFIFESGVYGTSSHSKEARIKKSNYNKVKAFFKRSFPSLKEMKGRYHTLIKRPYLLPFFYIYRIICFIVKKIKKAFKK